MNKVIMMGRLTHDPEIKIIDNEKRLCRYRIAVARRYNPKEADFFNCVAFGKSADFVSRWFHKGDMIAIAGRLQNNNYETATGEKRTNTEIIIEEQSFCGGLVQNKFEPVNDEDEDMPF